MAVDPGIVARMRECLVNTLHDMRKLGILLAGILAAAPLVAQLPITAMLTITGRVTVNGSNVPATTAVLRGDRIQTAKDGAAALSLPGSSVTLSPNSDVTFQADALRVQSGTANITTSRGLRAEIDRVVVRPDSGSPAHFEVARQSNAILITARTGPLTLTGADVSTLEPGYSAVIRDGGSGTVRSRSSALSSKVVAAAGVGGGGAAVASTMAGKKRAEDSSPMHP